LHLLASEKGNQRWLDSFSRAPATTPAPAPASKPATDSTQVDQVFLGSMLVCLVPLLPIPGPHVSGLLSGLRWSALGSSCLLWQRLGRLESTPSLLPGRPFWAVPPGLERALAAGRRDLRAIGALSGRGSWKDVKGRREPCCGVLHSVAQRARVRSLTVVAVFSLWSSQFSRVPLRDRRPALPLCVPRGRPGSLLVQGNLLGRERCCIPLWSPPHQGVYQKLVNPRTSILYTARTLTNRIGYRHR
jgi:hypothetical protein